MVMIQDKDEGKWLVSVQWGKGFHYFITPTPVEARMDAIRLVDRCTRRLQRQIGKRGARPTVRLLKIDMNINITP